MSQIYELIPKVMTEIGAIPKSDKNRQQNYNFRSIDAVLKAFQPVLTKHNVSLSMQCEDFQVQIHTEEKAQGKGDRSIYHASLRMRVTLFAPDGTFITNISCGEGIDYGGDKAANKAMAAAFKYAMLLGLCVPVEAGEMDDSDRLGPPVQEKPKTSVSNTDQVREVHINEIQRLCQEVGWTKDKLIEVLATKGIQKPSDLTIAQAEGLISKLKSLQLEKEADATFG